MRIVHFSELICGKFVPLEFLTNEVGASLGLTYFNMLEDKVKLRTVQLKHYHHLVQTLFRYYWFHMLAAFVDVFYMQPIDDPCIAGCYW